MCIFKIFFVLLRIFVGTEFVEKSKDFFDGILAPYIHFRCQIRELFDNPSLNHFLLIFFWYLARYLINIYVLLKRTELRRAQMILIKGSTFEFFDKIWIIPGIPPLWEISFAISGFGFAVPIINIIIFQLDFQVDKLPWNTKLCRHVRAYTGTIWFSGKIPRAKRIFPIPLLSMIASTHSSIRSFWS